MAERRDEPLAALPAAVGAVENREVFLHQVRRPLHGHSATGGERGLFHLLPREAEEREEVEAVLLGLDQVNAKPLQAGLAEYERRKCLRQVNDPRKLRFYLRDLLVVEPLRLEGGRVDVRGPGELARSQQVFKDILPLGISVAEGRQRALDRLVDDLEVAAASELLEFHESEVRLYAGRVAVHEKADRSGGRYHGRLRVPVAVLAAESQRVVPDLARRQGQLLWKETRINGMALVPVHLDHFEHGLAVLEVPGKWPFSLREVRRDGVRVAGHQARQRPAPGKRLRAVVR